MTDEQAPETPQGMPRPARPGGNGERRPPGPRIPGRPRPTCATSTLAGPDRAPSSGQGPHAPGDEGCRPGAAGPVVARCRVRRRRPRRGGGDCPRRLAHRKHRPTATPPVPTVTAPPPNHAGTTPPSGQSQARGHHHKPAGTSTTTSPVAAVPGGPPVISSLAPSGSAGQSIQVAGANFLSSSGQIVAMFNGTVAPTSCPAQNTCTVTVPPSSGGTSAQVTITTAGGTSNALTFTYH